MADFDVAQLHLKQALELAAGMTQGLRIFAEQVVELGLAVRRHGLSFGLGSVSPAIDVEHGAPTSVGRKDAQSEEAHSRVSENCASHANRCLHNHWLNNVGQNVPDDYTQIACAECSCRFHKFAFAGGQYLRSHKPRIA